MMTILFFFAAGAARPDHQHVIYEPMRLDIHGVDRPSEHARAFLAWQESRKNRDSNEFLDELQNEHVAGEDLIDGFLGIVSNSRAETDLEADLNVHARCASSTDCPCLRPV